MTVSNNVVSLQRLPSVLICTICLPNFGPLILLTRYMEKELFYRTIISKLLHRTMQVDGNCKWHLVANIFTKLRSVRPSVHLL